MLKSSTKSVARDVVSTLIDPNESEGVLLKMTKLIESLPEYEVEEDDEWKFFENGDEVKWAASKPSSKWWSSWESSEAMKDQSS